MEYSKSEWDLLLWPHSWHKRINTEILTLIPCIILVGFFDVLGATNSILSDYIINSSSDIIPKVILFTIIAVIIGFLDVFCFAWPIADLCGYLAKRAEKHIAPGFNIILMKSYAYSHLPFLPLLLFAIPAVRQMGDFGSGTTFYTKAVFFLLLILLYTQRYWQLGIMLRTIRVKSKINFFSKLIITAAILLWMNIEAQAIYSLINFAYKGFGILFAP
jgi:hypothetical protein